MSKHSYQANGHKFIGYLVHLPGTDEFLAQMNVIGNNAGGWLWAATPEFAVRYESLEAAKQISEIYGESAAVKMLWEKDDRYSVTELD